MFLVRLEGDDNFRANVSHLNSLYGRAPSPKMQKERARKIEEYVLRFCRSSPPAIEAVELDPEVHLQHVENLTFSILFQDRGAATLFKLSYC